MNTDDMRVDNVSNLQQSRISVELSLRRMSRHRMTLSDNDMVFYRNDLI